MSDQAPSGRHMQHEMARAANRGNGLAFVYWLRLARQQSKAAKDAEAAKILADLNRMTSRLAEKFRPILALYSARPIDPPVGDGEARSTP